MFLGLEGGLPRKAAERYAVEFEDPQEATHCDDSTPLASLIRPLLSM